MDMFVGEEEPAICDVAYYTLLGSYHEVELPLLKTPPKKDLEREKRAHHLLKTIMHITKCGDAASQAYRAYIITSKTSGYFYK